MLGKKLRKINGESMESNGFANSSSHYITVSNVLAVLKQYLTLVQKEQWDGFPVQLAFVSM